MCALERGPGAAPRGWSRPLLCCPTARHRAGRNRASINRDSIPLSLPRAAPQLRGRRLAPFLCSPQSSLTVTSLQTRAQNADGHIPQRTQSVKQKTSQRMDAPGATKINGQFEGSASQRLLWQAKLGCDPPNQPA